MLKNNTDVIWWVYKKNLQSNFEFTFSFLLGRKKLRRICLWWLIPHLYFYTNINLLIKLFSIAIACTPRKLYMFWCCFVSREKKWLYFFMYKKIFINILKILKYKVNKILPLFLRCNRQVKATYQTPVTY